MQIEIRITVGSAEEALAVTERLAAVRVVDERIAHDDRPDVGKPDPLPAPPVAPTLALAAAPAVQAVPAVDPAVAFAGVTLATGAVTMTTAVPPCATHAAAPALAVPPAPPAAAPAEAPAGIPPSAATAPTAAPERDSSGIVWDPRIHASTKSKKQDGTWTARRGVDEQLRATVEAELRGTPLPPAAPAAPAGDPYLAAMAPQAPVPPAPPAPPAATAVPQPPAPPAAPAAPGAAPTSFPELLARLGPALAAKPAEANAASAKVCQHPAINVPSLGSFAARPDLIPVFWELYKAEVAPFGIAL